MRKLSHLTLIAILALVGGCEASRTSPPVAAPAVQPPGGAAVAPPVRPPCSETAATPENTPQANVIISDQAITVDNGKVTLGQPTVTEEVERQIFQSLNYYRTAAESIEANVPGGNQASRQMRQDFDFSQRSFMQRYQLSEADIEAILKKGKQQGWK